MPDRTPLTNFSKALYALRLSAASVFVIVTAGATGTGTGAGAAVGGSGGGTAAASARAAAKLAAASLLLRRIERSNRSRSSFDRCRAERRVVEVVVGFKEYEKV